MISKTLGALEIEDTIKKEEKAESNLFKGNKPRSRKSSEKENDKKTMNFGLIVTDSLDFLAEDGREVVTQILSERTRPRTHEMKRFPKT